MTTPLPGTVPPNLTSPVPTSRQDAVNYYAQLLQSQYGAAVAKSFIGYAKDHPNLTAYNALQNWAGFIAAHLGPGLAKAIQGFVNDAGTGVSQFGSGVTSGLGQSSQDWQHLLLRLAEFGIGGTLITVGLFAMLSKSETAQKAGSGAVKVAKAIK